MYEVDLNIKKQVRAYDSDLYFKWNSQGEYFELWRKADLKPDQLITPITPAIYGESGPKKFVAVDERILWWIYAADTWKHGGSRNHALEADKKYQEFVIKSFKSQRSNFKSYAKDVWHAANNKFFKRYSPKNKPLFNNYRPNKRFIKPDVKTRTSSRVMKRSKASALALNYQRS